jgi:putative flippase GtrA
VSTERSPATSVVQRHGPLVAQFAKFGVVGVSNTLITYGVFTLLEEVFGVWYIAASGIGFAVGATNGFLLNRSWTFRGHGEGSGAAVRWFIVQGCGLLLDLALIAGFVEIGKLNKLIAQAFATMIVVVITFFVNRRWTFRAHLPRAEADPASVVASGTSAP